MYQAGVNEKLLLNVTMHLCYLNSMIFMLSNINNKNNNLFYSAVI